MQKLGKFFEGFLTDESGISSVEYALLLAFVAGGIILGADALSTAVTGEMEASADCIDGTVLAAAC